MPPQTVEVCGIPLLPCEEHGWQDLDMASNQVCRPTVNSNDCWQRRKHDLPTQSPVMIGIYRHNTSLPSILKSLSPPNQNPGLLVRRIGSIHLTREEESLAPLLEAFDTGEGAAKQVQCGIDWGISENHGPPEHGALNQGWGKPGWRYDMIWPYGI